MYKGSFLNAIWSHFRRAELYQVSRQCETLAGTGGGSIPDF